MKKNIAKIISNIMICALVFSTLPMVFVSAEHLVAEILGSYSNNFDATDMTEINDDFNFYWDGWNGWGDTLQSINRYKIENGMLMRDWNRAEEAGSEPDSEIHRPYRMTAYAMYKNQSFKDFTLTVNMKLGAGAGNAFNAITIGDYGVDILENNGWTVGFRIEAQNKIETFLGDEAATRDDFTEWCILNNHGSYRQYTREGRTDDIYEIKVEVSNGMAKLYIDGTNMYPDGINVGDVTGYISLISGATEYSGWDNLEIEKIPNVAHKEFENEIVSLTVNNLNNATEVGYDIYYNVDGVPKTENVCTNYINANAVGKTPFFVTDKRVYYADTNMDTEINSFDLTELRKELLFDVKKNTSDINGDKNVNIVDLVCIKKVLADTPIEISADTNRYNYSFSVSAQLEEADNRKIILQPYMIADGVRINGSNVEIISSLD